MLRGTLTTTLMLTWYYMKKRKNNSAAGHVKMSEFASQTIKTALIPNTNRDSVKHKHQKLLTNTQHKPYAHINKQRRKKQQKNKNKTFTNLSHRLRVGKLPSASTWPIGGWSPLAPAKRSLLKKAKTWTFSCPLFLFLFLKRHKHNLAHKIAKLRPTTAFTQLSFCHN